MINRVSNIKQAYLLNMSIEINPVVTILTRFNLRNSEKVLYFLL
jgi:hypothetical protein